MSYIFYDFFSHTIKSSGIQEATGGGILSPP